MIRLRIRRLKGPRVTCYPWEVQLISDGIVCYFAVVSDFHGAVGLVQTYLSTGVFVGYPAVKVIRHLEA